MMDVICDSMLIAARIGAQVGRDMQVDQVINSWKQHADALESQRNAAWRQIDAKNALLKEYDEHEDELIAKLAALRKENARLTEESKREARLKNAYKDELAVQTKKLEKAQAAATTNTLTETTRSTVLRVRDIAPFGAVSVGADEASATDGTAISLMSCTVPLVARRFARRSSVRGDSGMFAGGSRLRKLRNS